MNWPSKRHYLLHLTIVTAVFLPLFLSFTNENFAKRMNVVSATVKWNKNLVNWSYSPDGNPGGSNAWGEDAGEEINQGSLMWDQAEANFDFSPAYPGDGCSLPEEVDVYVYWDDVFYPGETDLTISGGYITDAEIILDNAYLSYGFGWDFDCDIDNNIDVRSVAVHEFGHAAGLNGSNDPNDVMYEYVDDATCRRNLSSRDKNALKSLYGSRVAPARTSFGNKTKFVGNYKNAKIQRFVDGQLFREQIGYLDFYYTHDLELKWIFEEHPELYLQMWSVASIFTRDNFDFITDDGLLKDVTEESILTKTDAAKLIDLLESVKKYASDELVPDINRFEFFVNSVVGMHYANIFKAAIGKQDIAPSIDGQKAGEQPVFFSLSQNFPNPFNPITKIEYALLTSSHAILRIYNANGQEIKTLVDKNLGPGVYSVIWDGKNNEGKDVSSGLYIYLLELGKVRVTKRMVLMR